MNNSIPDHIFSCISTLNSHGFEAWLVGGCVRDIIIGRIPHDFDVATNALPGEVLSVFEKVVPTGVKYGTVTVLFDMGSVEVTTFRTDGEYIDSRHPENVEFSGELESDLSRRDFTVNAIAYHPDKGFFDPFSGVDDIHGRLIKTVGSPSARFGEDALRIFRCFRFSAQLSFVIEQDTKKEALRLAKSLENISIERIAAELLKSLCAPSPENIEPLLDSGALEFLGIKNGELSPAKNLQNDEICRLAAFIYLTKSDIDVCKRLKLSNKIQSDTNFILDMLQKDTLPDKRSRKQLLNKTGFETYIKWLSLEKDLKHTDTDEFITEAENIIRENIPINLHMLDIDGNALKNAGIPDGQLIGQILNQLLLDVLDDPSLNKREILLEKSLEITKIYLLS